MIMDLIILAVFALTVYMTMRKGFVMSVVNFLKGFVSLIVAWIFCDDMADWLMNKTEAGIKTMTLLSDSLTSKWESSDIYLSLPEVFKESGEFATSLIESGTEKLTSTLLTIICFALIVFGLRLILSIIGNLLSHNHNKGFAGAMDWFLGSVLGIILGLIYVFVLLALMVPVLSLVIPEHCQTVLTWLDESFVAGHLYNNNLLLMLFRDLIG